MIWCMSILFLVVLGMDGMADTSPTNSIERYQIIMNHSPFKRFSDPISIASGPTAGSLTLQGFFATDKEKKVWLRDSSQNNKTFCVGEGESLNGYNVDKIDTENQTVRLTHGVDTLSLKFPEKNLAAPSPMASVQPAGRPVYRNPRVAVPPGLQPPVAPVPPTVTAPMPLAPIVSSPNTTTNDQQAGSPTSLRRRILRQNVKPVPPPAEAPAEMEEVPQTEQATEAAPVAR